MVGTGRNTFFRDDEMLKMGLGGWTAKVLGVDSQNNKFRVKIWRLILNED